MKQKFYIISIFLTLFCSYALFATDLRGRLARFDPNSRQYFPLGNVRVDIWIYNGVQWVDAASAVTGEDGMYYFLRFLPGTSFRIQVFGNFYPPQVCVVLDVLLQDIPEIIT